MSVKILKSLDMSSITVMATAINIVFSIIVSVIFLIIGGIVSVDFIVPLALLIPAIVCGTIMVSIYKNFIGSFIYNIISKKTAISFNIEDDGTISKISTTSTALIVAIISTIIFIMEYFVIMIIAPLMLSSGIQTLMMSGQAGIAYALYQVMMMITNPVFIAITIIGGFIVCFIYVLIATYLYNFIASKDYGIEVKISDNSTLDFIDSKSFSTAVAAIALVLGLISGIISAISSGQYFEIISNTVGNFIAGFVIASIIAFVYNKLSPKIGKIKFELIDE